MSEQQEATNQAEEEQFAYASDSVPLTTDLISQNISLVARTANGLSNAFTRFEIHDSQITNLANLKGFPHLRYIVSF